MPLEENLTPSPPQELRCGSDLRRKYWDELSIEEKIERIRQEVKGNQERTQNLSIKIDKLLRHQHLNNELVMKIEMYSEFAGEMSLKSDKVYF